jgi:DNA-binding IclR family transcriptional regulator
MPCEIANPKADNVAVRVKRPPGRRSVSRSATRALDILEFFGETRRPVRAIDIARALAMHPSTTNQLLKTLVESSHLIFDGRAKTYQPSPRLAGFGSWIVDSYGADLALSKVLKSVEAGTRTIVTLSAPNDLYMQILDLTGPRLGLASARRGLQVSLFGSAAIGAAYLSLLPDQEVERLTHRARLPRQQVSAVFRKVSRIRREGFASGLTQDGGFRSLAIPLPPGSAPIPLVVAIADRPERIECNQGALLHTMREAITHWSSAKGCGSMVSSGSVAV